MRGGAKGKAFASTPAAGDRPGLAARQVAGKLLAAILDKKTSLDGLTDATHGHPGFRALEARDRALVKAILLSALRYHGTLQAMLDACLDRPLPANAAALRHLLTVAAAQIVHLDVPDSAAVDLAVAAASADPRARRFSGLANAVLRRLSREKETLARRLDDPLRDCPAWLAERLEAQYGATDTRRIAEMHRHPPAFDLSVKGDPGKAAERLGGFVLPTGTVRLFPFEGAITEKPGFQEGEWWVQDAASALPARLLGDVRGRPVADLCAAPGGKTAQLAHAGAKVDAFDISASRMRRLEENLKRVRLAAGTAVLDIAAHAPETRYDAVLLDAPCSSTGTIRRHPDVAYTKDAAEVEKLSGVQLRLLSAATRFLSPGGRLVFSNCSLLREEGEAVIDAFLRDHPDFRLDPVRPEEMEGLPCAVTVQGYLRTTPTMLATGADGAPAKDMEAAEPALSGLDGFFAARLRRLV